MEVATRTVIGADEGLAIVARVFEAFSRDDLDGMLELWTADAQLEEAPTFVPDGSTYRGRDAIRRYWQGYWRVWTEISAVPDRAVAHGEAIGIDFRFNAKGRTSGATIETRGACLVSFAGDLVRRVVMHRDIATALRDG